MKPLNPRMRGFLLDFFRLLLLEYILGRRAFRRIQDDRLGPVGRTQASHSNKFHAAAQRYFFAMLLMASDRSPCSADDKWFECISVLDFDCIGTDNLRRNLNCNLLMHSRRMRRIENSPSRYKSSSAASSS